MLYWHALSNKKHQMWRCVFCWSKVQCSWDVSALCFVFLQRSWDSTHSRERAHAEYPQFIVYSPLNHRHNTYHIPQTIGANQFCLQKQFALRAGSCVTRRWSHWFKNKTRYRYISERPVYRMSNIWFTSKSRSPRLMRHQHCRRRRAAIGRTKRWDLL